MHVGRLGSWVVGGVVGVAAAAGVAGAVAGCGGPSASARTATGVCDQAPPALPTGATFGDLVDRATGAAATCAATDDDARIAVRWAPVDQPHIRLSPDAVDVGSSSTTVCAWYGRCDPATGQRELLDEQSVLSTVDCLLETGPTGGVVVQASRDVSAHVLLTVVQRVTAAGRTVDVERRPVSFWYPCRPTARARARARAELPEDVLRAAVTPRLRQVRQRCFSGAHVPRDHRGGRLLLRFTLSPDGSVEDVTNAASTLDLPEVEQCVLSQVRAWTFPAPGGDESVVVTYPLELRRR